MDDEGVVLAGPCDVAVVEDLTPGREATRRGLGSAGSKVAGVVDGAGKGAEEEGGGSGSYRRRG